MELSCRGMMGVAGAIVVCLASLPWWSMVVGAISLSTSVAEASPIWWPWGSAATIAEKKENGEKDYSEEYYYYEEIVPLRRASNQDYYYYDDLRYPPYVNRRSGVKEPEEDGINPLAALIAPLAGLALLGAITSVSVDPLFMEITTLNRKGRQLTDSLTRKVSDAGRTDSWIGEDAEALEADSAPRPQSLRKLREVKLLEEFLTGLPGYEIAVDGLATSYLTGSGLTRPDNACLEYLTCRYTKYFNASSPTSASLQVSSVPNPESPPAVSAPPESNAALNRIERDVTSIVLYNLMRNSFIEEEVKKKLRKAARFGRDGGSCHSFNCDMTTTA